MAGEFPHSFDILSIRFQEIGVRAAESISADTSLGACRLDCTLQMSAVQCSRLVGLDSVYVRTGKDPIFRMRIISVNPPLCGTAL